MQNTFNVVGVSKLANSTVYKVRFANGLATRIKVLVRNGHTDVNLIELASASTKIDAVKQALASDAFDAEQIACLQAFAKANSF